MCRKAAVLGRGAAARRVRDAAAEVRRKERDNMMARCAIIKGYNGECVKCGIIEMDGEVR